MLKRFAILFLLAAITLSAACSSPSRCPSPSCPSPVGNEFDSSQLLSDLRQESQPFANFYDDKIASLGYTIRWFQNPSLPPEAFRTCE
jgi:ABC-type phosphate/phosphonate transport system substrate-binding protein